MKQIADCYLYGILDLGYVAAARACDVGSRMIDGGADALQLRYGLRASATIPYAAIAAIEPSVGDWHRRKGTLKVAIADSPRTIIRLREPMTIQSIAGIRRVIDTIAILPDDDRFEAALRAKLPRE